MTPIQQSLEIQAVMQHAPSREPPSRNGWKKRVNDWLKRLKRYGRFATPQPMICAAFCI